MLSKSSTTEFHSQHSEIIFKSINLKKIVIEEPLPRKIILLIQCRNGLVFEFPAPPFHALMSRLMSSLILWSGSVVCSHSFPFLIILHMLQVPSIKLSQSHEAHRVLISYCLFKRAFIADVSFFLFPFFLKKKVCVSTQVCSQHAVAYVEVRTNLQNPILFFYRVSSCDQTPVTRPGGSCLSLLSHLDSQLSFPFSW